MQLCFIITKVSTLQTEQDLFDSHECHWILSGHAQSGNVKRYSGCTLFARLIEFHCHCLPLADIVILYYFINHDSNYLVWLDD